MKNTLKRLILCVATVVLCLLGISGAGKLLAPASTASSINSIKAFHKLEKDSLDVMFFGTSHTWDGCDPRVLEEKYGLRAWNYGANWQGFNTTLLFLRDALRTQSPKVVCIDTYMVNSLLKNIKMEGQIYYTRAIPAFDGKKEFLKDCFGDDWKNYVPYYIPLVMFHDNWAGVRLEDFSKNRSVKYYMETRGFEGSDEVQPVHLEDFLTPSQNSWLPEDSIEVLDKMLQACNEKGIKVIFYTCPYEGYYIFSDIMKAYAEANECVYLNMFDMLEEIGFDENSDFRDTQHLNNSGAGKLADFMGKYIVENYLINNENIEE